MIKENIQKIFSELPDTVELEAACKARSIEEILAAIEAGIKIIGENYIQEAESAFKVIGNKAKWHFIGHLQKNKVKKTVKIFDMIETIDSLELVELLNKACLAENKTMPVLIEVNSGRENQKFGVLPEDVKGLIGKISKLDNIKVMGLMTMGPMTGEPDQARPYFIETKKLFEDLKKQNFPNVEMKYLSMGMSNSYKVAIEEGANLVRIGSRIFGNQRK